ncbi:hypothetical protein ACFQJ5_16690 [Halomicroarcula sp. GCM10025324]|uniref:hypothetical protein n=1 Tax=Haloarcula TaxID=2237 RepID=UPI0023E83279|nr:hypothetical protein [Halomicroarcula sp. ZS-22-S1]
MPDDRAGGEEPPDSGGNSPRRPWRTDWRNIDERRRERARLEAAGASRDLTATLLAGGGV